MSKISYMYVGLHVKYLLFMSEFDDDCIFSTEWEWECNKSVSINPFVEMVSLHFPSSLRWILLDSGSGKSCHANPHHSLCLPPLSFKYINLRERTTAGARMHQEQFNVLRGLRSLVIMEELTDGHSFVPNNFTPYTMWKASHC